VSNLGVFFKNLQKLALLVKKVSNLGVFFKNLQKLALLVKKVSNLVVFSQKRQKLALLVKKVIELRGFLQKPPKVATFALGGPSRAIKSLNRVDLSSVQPRITVFGSKSSISLGVPPGNPKS
jgi:hypothetical protein